MDRISRHSHHPIQKKFSSFIVFTCLLVLNACATYKTQYGRAITQPTVENSIKIEQKSIHRFFLVGDAGNADEGESKIILQNLKLKLKTADSASTLLFLGDNIYPKGMPTDLQSEERKLAEEKLQFQIDLGSDFAGKTIFIPGNHDWYNGLIGLKAQEKFVTQQLGDNSFLPKNSCGIDYLNIHESIGLITIDSQWFLENWDKHKKINANCNIKTREDFFKEFEQLLNKNQNKLCLVALHHPLVSNSQHGGQFSVKDQLFPLEPKIPLPIFGSFINFIRKTSGIISQDTQHPVYRNFINRMKTLLKDRNNVVFISGHDHTLQYIEIENLKQIVSGSGSKNGAARAIHKNDFSFGGYGYAVLDVFENGQSTIQFYGLENGKESLLFEHQLTYEQAQHTKIDFPKELPAFETSQIYPAQLTQKNKAYQFFFGNHYRSYYSLPIQAPVLNLTNFKQNIYPNQSTKGLQRTLEIESKNGNKYEIKSLKKSATQYLQSLAFKDQYIEKNFENTFAEEFLLDFYTTNNPYYQFALPILSDSLQLLHPNSKLVYLPKQQELGQYNDNYGDELYQLEELSNSQNNTTKILSTNDVLLKLQSDEKYKIDEQMYIRARLFDMLIGDWDRHEDQWSWIEKTENDHIIFQPISKNHDQAFPKYDGFLLSLAMRIPALKHMQTFNENIKNVKWFNKEAYPLDLALIRNATLEDWLKEAEIIYQNLDDLSIETAFQAVPNEVKDEELENIKKLIKIRKEKLKPYATAYYKVLSKTIVLFATNQHDKILVQRFKDGQTHIQFSHLTLKSEKIYLDKIYSKKNTQEIWIYGLNSADEFVVEGNAKGTIMLRLIGGNDRDTYKITDGRKVRIYDNERQFNNLKTAQKAKVYLSNDYELNQYDYKKPKYNRFSLLPTAGYNPDDQTKLGLIATYQMNRFDRSPFTRKHQLLVNYYFSTKAWELSYTGTFAKFINKWNLEIKAHFTNPTYTTNFFGFGNETYNHEDELGMNYNRIKIQSLSLQPSIYKIGRNNDRLEIQSKLEDVLVLKNLDRITGNTTEISDATFDHNYFASSGIKYSYSNYDVISLPTLGSHFDAEINWITNLGDTKKSFPYFTTSLGFVQRITNNGNLTFSTLLNGKLIWNNNFEFFQAASIGGDNDLRAYRTGRFIGRQSFFQTSDLRLQIFRTKENFFPMKFGINLGYDYGRVWLDDEKSTQWHQSIGGGIWVNGINTLTGKINYFYGSDGGRVSFGFNIGF